MLVSVESSDKHDVSTLAIDFTKEEFRTVEVSLFQVLHSTTGNAPLRMVQQTQGQNGFEAWHAIVRRYDQRNMSAIKSACVALISNIAERDRVKDVQQFDDILRTFVDETNKFENRFGKIRDEEKMFAVRKLTPESLLKVRFCGAMMSYNELLISLENIRHQQGLNSSDSQTQEH